MSESPAILAVDDIKDHADRMDRMYRYQRHIYDMTRKYYLLGRDRAIRELQVPKKGTLLEVALADLRELQRVVLGSTLLASLLFLVLAWWGAGVISRPLEALTQRARLRTSSRHSPVGLQRPLTSLPWRAAPC